MAQIVWCYLLCWSLVLGAAPCRCAGKQQADSRQPTPQRETLCCSSASAPAAPVPDPPKPDCPCDESTCCCLSETPGACSEGRELFAFGSHSKIGDDDGSPRAAILFETVRLLTALYEHPPAAELCTPLYLSLGRLRI